MKIVLPILLLLSLSVAASECPDPKQRSAEIGGHVISAALIRAYKPVPGAWVELYSGRKLVWNGTTGRDGTFKIQNLASGTYTMRVGDWGKTTIRLNPKLDRVFGTQTANWNLVLSDHGCISWGMNTD